MSSYLSFYMSEIVLPGNQLYLETKCNLYEAGEFDETFRSCYFSISGFNVDETHLSCLLVGKINSEIGKSSNRTQAMTILPLASTITSGILNISHSFESWRCLQKGSF